MTTISERAHAIEFDDSRCIGCVECSRACPSKAIRVRNNRAVVDHALCLDCGACIRTCRHQAVRARTANPSDLRRFQHTVALPSLTLYAQFGRDVDPPRVLQAIRSLGFNGTYDISWMCEMLAGATDAYLSECGPPWPKISVTCPAIVRLVQIRYPDMIGNLVPIESARELAAKLLRRKLSRELGLEPREIGLFFVTPCSAIVNSILNPIGLEASYLDGAFSIAELYGPLLRALKELPPPEDAEPISERGLLWAMAGGEIAGMRNANTMTVRGVRDILRVFDHLEEGSLRAVDFIEAYICPDGCVSGQLTVEGRYGAQRNIREIARRLGAQKKVDEEKVRSLVREHFFDLERHITARPIRPLAASLAEAIARRKEQASILSQLPGKDCAACGAPDCATHASDVVRGAAALEDCVFIELDRLKGVRRDEKEESVSKHMLILDLACPQCTAPLTEGSKVVLDAHVEETHGDGVVALSAVFGDYSIETDLEIPEKSLVEFRCPKCDADLMLPLACKLCGAPMASLNLRGGGYIEFCSRRGCRAHALGGEGNVDDMMRLVNQMFETPYD